MSTSLYAKTPSVTVLDGRGLAVRDIVYYRHPNSLDSTEERTTRHQYDARGALVQSTDPRLFRSGVANVNYLRDLSDRVLRTTSVDAGVSVLVNDPAGRPAMTVDALGTVGTFQYESAELPGRPLSMTEQVKGENARIAERFVYADNAVANKALNRAGQCVSHYDTAGLMQTESFSLTGVPLSVTRQLLKAADTVDWQGKDPSVWNGLLASEAYTTLTTTDATGGVLTTRDAFGHLQRMAYDVAGQLSASWLTRKGGKEQAIVRSLTWSAAGQKRREEHANGVVTISVYEPETGRLSRITTARPTGHPGGAKVLQDLHYAYDPVGNVLRIYNDAEDVRFWRNQKVLPENTFAYDSLYQLVSATGREMANAGRQGSALPALSSFDDATYTSYTRAYTYDTAGNLTQIRHSAPASGNNYTADITVSNRSNRAVLSTLTKNPAEVDALFTAGGPQKQVSPGQDLLWTPRGELSRVMPVVRDGAEDDRAEYRYDSDSQRILKTRWQKINDGTQTQRTLYLPGLEWRTTTRGSAITESLQVITQGEAGQTQVRLLHWESGKPDDIGNDSLRWSYGTLTGSCALELDADGATIDMEEFYPFGGTAVWTSRSQAEADNKTRRYSGKERDATGLYYYGYRYYQPWLGRWLSADPAGTVDGLNLYRMVRNNPLLYVDKKGCAPAKPDVDLVDEMLSTIVAERPHDIKPKDVARSDRMMNKLFNLGEEISPALPDTGNIAPVTGQKPLVSVERHPVLNAYRAERAVFKDIFNEQFSSLIKHAAIENLPESAGADRHLSDDSSVMANYQSKLQEYTLFRHAQANMAKAKKDVRTEIIQHFR